jgi:hypothetical protein
MACGKMTAIERDLIFLDLTLAVFKATESFMHEWRTLDDAS